MENIELRQRFKDADFFPQNDVKVGVFGAGGIGSWVTFFLSRIGYKVCLIDFDRVEEHNIGGQLFRVADINKLKVNAVSDIIKDFCNEVIDTFTFRVDNNVIAPPLTIAAFDNMQARTDLFESWVRNNSNSIVQPLFIDGRLTMDTVQIIAIPYNLESIQKYRTEYLFSDATLEEEACTAKQSSHTAALIGSHIVTIFANHIANINIGTKIKPIPFYYEFFAPFQFTTEIDELEIPIVGASSEPVESLNSDDLFPDVVITSSDETIEDILNISENDSSENNTDEDGIEF